MFAIHDVAKPHPGQIRSAANIRKLLEGSRLARDYQEIVDQAAGSEPLGRGVASIALPNQLLGTPSATGVMWYAVASY